MQVLDVPKSLLYKFNIERKLLPRNESGQLTNKQIYNISVLKFNV